MKNNFEQKRRTGYLMLVPATILILLVSIYPLFRGIYLAMLDYRLQNVKNIRFIGFENIFNIIFKDPEFYRVLGYTLVYTFFAVVISYIFGLILALLLNKDIKFRGLFRALILLPWVIPPVVAATNWLWILNDQFGLINHLFMSMKFIEKPILFLGDVNLAKVTVIVFGVWKAIPFMMIVLLAGLQSISNDLYEAAYLDGANFIQSFRYVTFPMLNSVSTIAVTLMFIWTFNNFENVYLLTSGGPITSTYVLSILSYNTAFFKGDFGYASAISTVIMLLLLGLSTVYLKVSRKESY